MTSGVIARGCVLGGSIWTLGEDLPQENMVALRQRSYGVYLKGFSRLTEIKPQLTCQVMVLFQACA